MVFWKLLLLVTTTAGMIFTKPGRSAVTIFHAGLEIEAPNAGTEFIAISKCECRKRCVVQPDRCVGYSYSPGQTCRLAYQYSLGVPKEGASYTYFLPDGLPEFTSHEADGLYYYYYNKNEYNITEARKLCLAKPGFRLARPKTKETADIFRNIHEEADFYVDLTRREDGVFAFGDGTEIRREVLKSGEPRYNSGNKPHVGVYYSLFDGLAFGSYYGSERLGYLCQANYDDMPW